MSRSTHAFVMILALAACSKKDEKAAPAPSTVEATSPKETPKKPLTAELFGKTVAPPGPLAKLTRGMPEKDAEKALDAANAGNELAGVHWWMGLGKDGKLDDTLIELPTAQRGVVAQAWGPGLDSERAGKPNTMWFNPEIATRAELSDDRDHSTLRFEAYVPLAKLFGDGPQIAALSKPIVGLSKEDLAKAYPELADKDGHLWLPPTEWEFGSGIPVSPYPMDGAIESVAFSIPFNKRDPKGKDDLYAAFEKKWGKVKSVDELDPKTKIYNNANPRIEVSEDTYSNGTVTVRVSEPEPKGKKR